MKTSIIKDYNTIAEQFNKINTISFIGLSELEIKQLTKEYSLISLEYYTWINNLLLKSLLN